MNGPGRQSEEAHSLPVSVSFVSLFVHKLYTLIVGNRVLRATVITLWYMSVISISYYVAFLLRFDGYIPPSMSELIPQTLPVLLLVRIISFQRFGLYSGLLRYVSVDDVLRKMKAIFLSTLIFMVIIYALRPGFMGFPRSVFVVEAMLTLGILSGYRMTLRALRERPQNGTDAEGETRKILIIGDLDAADSLLRVLKSKHNRNNAILGIIHEDPLATGKTLRDIKVLGGLADLPTIIRTSRPSEVLILPPYSASPRSLRDAVDRCKIGEDFSCKFRMVPSLLDIAAGKTTVSMIRNVEIEDLLGRPPVKMDRTEVREFLRGKAVMVTGAGGSIGSEICRQVANYEPLCLVLYELAEYNLYQIEMDLTNSYPSLKVIPIAGDVCDETSLARVVQRYRIEAIYHAAAYKHVPLMECNVVACVRNNLIGTERVAKVAERFGVEKFVLISSDKAVRPVSVMGATKQLAERVIQERPVSGTKFVAVRFGNVLGSSGSVIPLFKKQIEAGGPVTVTHPDVMRYFMSIHEAVDLVLQASVMGNDREIMVLEMGEPIRIQDLATRLIVLSGLRPGKDIEIAYTGLRPGEKLCEELTTEPDDLVRSAYEKIWVMHNHNDGNNRHPLHLSLFENTIEEDDEARLRTLLNLHVPDNRPDPLRPSLHQERRG